MKTFMEEYGLVTVVIIVFIALIGVANKVTPIFESTVIDTIFNII